ncbi:hypothetical protein [Botrimarina colliarenosi]|uniref:hypothetical protein n=1 Tax=Botrimarina colliarenosi TaxID=2528001 RepID=UPI0011B518AD|nr:hypothetical protein [Botrimarina colliarenosi]
MTKLTPASLSLLASVVAAAPCHALIVKTWNGAGTPSLINTTAPPDDPGYANLPANGTGVYLGDNLFLTAVHNDGTAYNGSGSWNIAGRDFPVIPGSQITLTNPTTFAGRTLDANADLRLYRIGVDPLTGLTPEELDPSIRRIDIASSLVGTSEAITMFGTGVVREVNAAEPSTGQHYFDSAGNVLYNSSSWPSATYRGFGYGGPASVGPRPWHWGTNTRVSSIPSNIVRSGGNVLVEAGGLKDTVGFMVRFDQNGLPDEAQGAGGDSGGPVFRKEGDEWVLAGLTHAVIALNGNNKLLGAFGSYTLISDVSQTHYRDQIVGARGVYSKMGDLDLDGSITGSIVNGVATGDLGILVDNWLYQSGEADVHSWMRGDLNQDGQTDLLDFVLMREALGGSISSSSFAQLIAAQSVPEPGAVLLAALALGAAMPGRRR